MFPYIFIPLCLVIIVLAIIFRKEITFFIVGFSSKKRVERKLYFGAKENDYLIINDYLMKVDERKYRHVDSLIFGNKFIYVVKIIKQAGEVKIIPEDNKWRVIYKGSLTNIDNPILENRRKINRLMQVSKLERQDFVSLIVFTKTCEFEVYKNDEKTEIVVLEDEAINTIRKLEKESNADVFDSKEIEACAKAFYDFGLKSEKEYKENKRGKING